MMINWRAVITGFILAFVLGLGFGIFAGSLGSSLGIVIAGIVVGYTVNRDLMNGLIHGALIGVIGGIILAIAVIIAALAAGGGLGAAIAVGGIITIIASVILWGFLGAIGGGIGAEITKNRRKQPQTVEESEVQSIEGIEPVVEFNMENFKKCVCPQCPVQAESDCAQTKMKMLQESMKGMSPEPADIPGLYCASGTATCKDLNPNKTCNCPNCDVFKENNLAHGEPGGYFCQNGKAM
jgi:hypothetical protein